MIKVSPIKIIIEKEKFLNLLKKLIIDDNPYGSNIKIENGKLISKQTNDKCTVYSNAVFEKSYFKSIDGSDAFSLNVETLLGVCKHLDFLSKDELLTIKKKKGKLYINGGNISFNFRIEPCYEEIDKEYPSKQGHPIVEETLLDTHFIVNLKDLREFTQKERTESTVFSFIIDDGELSIMLHQPNLCWFNDVKRIPRHRIVSGNTLKVTFDHWIHKVLPMFSQDMIHVHTKTGFPGWFSEKTKDYALGVMLANLDED